MRTNLSKILVVLILMILSATGCNSQEKKTVVTVEQYNSVNQLIANYVAKCGNYSSTMASIVSDNAIKINASSTVDFTKFNGFNELYNTVINDSTEFMTSDITEMSDVLRLYYNKAYELASQTKTYFSTINRRVTKEKFQDLMIDYTDKCRDIYAELSTLRAKAELEYLNSNDLSEGVDQLNSQLSGSADESGYYTVSESDSVVVKHAKMYLNVSAFSYSGLVEQLRYEGRSESEAKEAIDCLTVDWNKQALKSATSYLKVSGFSFKRLSEQLMYEGFSEDEAWYGAFYCNADWKQQAVKKAKSYLSVMTLSGVKMIEQLEYEGFTHEEAEYAVTQVGL